MICSCADINEHAREREKEIEREREREWIEILFCEIFSFNNEKSEKRKCFHKNRNGAKNEGVLIYMFYLHDQKKKKTEIMFCFIVRFYGGGKSSLEEGVA